MDPATLARMALAGIGGVALMCLSGTFAFALRGALGKQAIAERPIQGVLILTNADRSAVSPLGAGGSYELGAQAKPCQEVVNSSQVAVGVVLADGWKVGPIGSKCK